MPAEGLTDAQGRGHKNLAHDTVSLANDGTHDFAGELSSIDRAWAESTVDDPATELHVASIASVSGTTVTLSLADIDGTDSGAAVTAAENVKLYAVGDA